MALAGATGLGQGGSVITLKGISKAYGLGGGTVSALDDVSLTIKRGEYLAVMGPPGSGKSTLLHILGILDRATGGQYFLEDYDITALPDKEHARIRNRHFGFIFQSFNLISELSALENVMLPMSYAGVPSRKRRERAALLLGEVGLSSRMQHRPSMMPGGEQQRVAIARALANDPDIILADEPTGDLPSDKGEEIMSMLESLNAKGVTIVLGTRDPDRGRRARRRIQIRDGRLCRDENSEKAENAVNA
jgi:putative ABC transport system ATP-binding protein